MTFRFYGISIRTRQGFPVRGLRIGGTSALAVIEKLNRMYPGCTVLNQVPLWVSEKSENSANVSAAQLTMQAIFDGPNLPLTAPASGVAPPRASMAKPGFKAVSRPIDVLARAKVTAEQPAAMALTTDASHSEPSQGRSLCPVPTRSKADEPVAAHIVTPASEARAPETAKVLQAALNAASVSARASRMERESRHGYWLSPSTA